MNKRKDYVLYYDMDNTLCFWGRKEDRLEILKKVRDKGFFANLKPIDNCEKALTKLFKMRYEIKIISACEDTEHCYIEKREWIKKYLPFITDKNIILCKIGENKTKFVQDITKSILIDDYGKNLNEWMEAGGIAVKKSFSGKKRNIPVVKDHMDIFKVLKALSA